MADLTRIAHDRGGDARVGLDELAGVRQEDDRRGRIIAAALEAEVDDYVQAFTGEVDENARRLVARNGHAQRPREGAERAGRVSRVSRVRDVCAAGAEGQRHAG